LKAAFDASFAVPTAAEPRDREELLVIRAGGRPAAVRVRHVAEVHPCPPLTRLPSERPALAGLAAVRGSLVAVYDLATLAAFGEPVERPGLLFLCAEDRSVALLFHELLGHRSVPPEALHSPVHVDGSTRASVVVTIDDTNHDLIDIPRHLHAIHTRARAQANKE
jgi:two-component system chemotaxis response regulator CheV